MSRLRRGHALVKHLEAEPAEPTPVTTPPVVEKEEEHRRPVVSPNAENDVPITTRARRGR